MRGRVRDDERRAEACAGGGTEEVWIGERVPEDALVRRSRGRERPADDRAEDHTRQPQLPQDRVVGARERRMQSEHMREGRSDDVHRSQVNRPDEEPDEQRRREEHDGGDQREPRARG